MQLPEYGCDSGRMDEIQLNWIPWNGCRSSYFLKTLNCNNFLKCYCFNNSFQFSSFSQIPILLSIISILISSFSLHSWTLIIFPSTLINIYHIEFSIFIRYHGNPTGLLYLFPFFIYTNIQFTSIVRVRFSKFYSLCRVV